RRRSRAHRRRSVTLTARAHQGAFGGPVIRARGLRVLVRSWRVNRRFNRAPPSRNKGAYTMEADDGPERGSMASNGMVTYTPLSNEPSPNSSAETFVLVA